MGYYAGTLRVLLARGVVRPGVTPLAGLSGGAIAAASAAAGLSGEAVHAAMMKTLRDCCSMPYYDALRSGLEEMLPEDVHARGEQKGHGRGDPPHAAAAALLVPLLS